MEGTEEEERIKKCLLRESARLWSEPFQRSRVSEQAEEMCCGWRQVHACAEYDLIAKPRRKKRIMAPVAPARSRTFPTPEETRDLLHRAYMSGELDETFSYVYKGGLSDKTSEKYDVRSSLEGVEGTLSDSGTPGRPQPIPKTTVILEPLMLPPHAQRGSLTQAEALVRSRAELARILALQVKPELLVEQLIIENRLRTMSMAAFPRLEGIGVEAGAERERRHAYSKSTPALGATLRNTHVHHRSKQKYRHKQNHHQWGNMEQERKKREEERKRHERKKAQISSAKPQLRWCGLSGGEVVEEVEDSVPSHAHGEHLQLQSQFQNTRENVLTFQQGCGDLNLHCRGKGQGKNGETSESNNLKEIGRIGSVRRYNSDAVVPTNTQLAPPEPQLSVVSPSLGGGIAGKGRRQKNHLSSLLPSPSDAGRTVESGHLFSEPHSLYHPKISYSNSKHMKF